MAYVDLQADFTADDVQVRGRECGRRATRAFARYQAARIRERTIERSPMVQLAAQASRQHELAMAGGGR